MKKIIEVKNLKKSYGEFQAVKGISFYVEEGKLFSFLGPNGAGKSTTIDTLCTLNEYQEGEITIGGKDLRRSGADIRNMIGVVYQDSILDGMLTVRENLMLRAGFYIKEKHKIKQAVRYAAAATEVMEFIDRPYGKLSGGQRRRVDIARALLHKPKILFLDEPTTGLDPQTRKVIWSTIRRLQKENGMTVFLTTHYMEEASESDYVIVMDHGEIAAKGTPSELKEAYANDKLCLNVSEREKVVNLLAQSKTDYYEEAGRIIVKLKQTIQAIPVIERYKEYISGFEVLNGTMDDAFLGITGRELRE